MPESIRALLLRDAGRLQQALHLDAVEARIEVQSLLQYVLRRNRAWVLAHDDEALDAGRQAVYAALLRRRLQGEPVAYILGEREFFGLPFKVTPATLIPRPETELLVELALLRITQGMSCRVLDLGTGSGAIALSIAHERPDVAVTAVDASAEALKVAECNAQVLAIRNVDFLCSNWFEELGGRNFELIVSNPPYVAAGDPHLGQGDLPFEPLSALAAGADGLDDIRKIVAGAPVHLRQGGWLLLEHGYNQAAQVRELLCAQGFGAVFSARDLAGVERVSGGRLGT